MGVCVACTEVRGLTCGNWFSPSTVWGPGWNSGLYGRHLYLLSHLPALKSEFRRGRDAK